MKMTKPCPKGQRKQEDHKTKLKGDLDHGNGHKHGSGTFNTATCVVTDQPQPSITSLLISSVCGNQWRLMSNMNQDTKFLSQDLQ